SNVGVNSVETGPLKPPTRARPEQRSDPSLAIIHREVLTGIAASRTGVSNVRRSTSADLWCRPGEIAYEPCFIALTVSSVVPTACARNSKWMSVAVYPYLTRDAGGLRSRPSQPQFRIPVPANRAGEIRHTCSPAFRRG